MTESVAIIGLGYVGLPLALAIARAHKNTIGFDINAGKLASLKTGIDPNGEVPPSELAASSIAFTSNPADLKKSTFFIVCVPTPVDPQNRPDMTPLVKASELIGSVISKGAMVVFESTVYPGVTQDICGPIIAKTSGLKSTIDFKLGYSPERINPGDKEHTVERITKIVSGEDADSLQRATAVYGAVVTAGIYQAPSIRVAEAAKVIENTQRDVNIALMNELSMLFDRLGLRTSDVLAAAGTKWNFLPFRPGLVGGHCIGVDPYYLTAKAEEVGFHPQMILAGRRINDGVASFVAQKTAKLLSQSGANLTKAKVGILGLTFKENVSDIRNSKVPEIVRELREFGITVLLHDPIADNAHAQHEYGLSLSPLCDFTGLDAVIVAVAHKQIAALSPAALAGMLSQTPESPTGVFSDDTGLGSRESDQRPKPGVIIDIKSIVPYTKLRPNITYWSL